MWLSPPRLTWAAIPIFLVAFGPIVAAAGPSAPSPVVLVPEAGQGAVPLDGLWQFHSGDDTRWAQPEFEDGNWELLTADRPWGLQGHPGYAGFAWYRRHITFPGGAPAALSLLLPDVEESYEVYWNGSLIGKCGRLAPFPVWDVHQQPHIFPLPAAGPGVLALRVWRAPPLSDEDPGLRAGFMTEPLVGTPQAVADAKGALDFRWLNGHQFMFTEDLLYALVALLSGLAWFRHRDQPVLFWMTGYTVIPPLLGLLLDARLPVPYALAMGLAQPITAVREISLWFLLLWLLDLQTSKSLLRLTRGLSWVSLSVNAIDGAFCALIGIAGLARMAQAGDALATILDGVIALFPLLLVGAALKRRKRFERSNLLVALSAFSMEMVIVLRDLSAEGSRYTHWHIQDMTDGPLAVVGGSTISLMNILEAVLFASLVYAVYYNFSDHKRRQVLLMQEMRSAGELQRMLVPHAPVELPGIRLGSAFQPAQEVGGDFFQVIPMEGLEEAVLVVLGDVSGKGMKAAMAVAFIVGAIRGLLRPAMGPAQLLTELNQQLMGRLNGGFTTCLVIRIGREGNCRVASAGHPAPFLDDREVELGGSLPLGLVAGAQYEDRDFELEPGQSCTLFSDGLLEARSAGGELYGYARLSRLLAGRPDAKEAAQAGVDFGQDDDITVVTLTRLAGIGANRHAKPEADAGTASGSIRSEGASATFSA